MNSVAETPIFPLHTVLFPEGPLHLRIFETRYVDMVSRCLKEGSPFVVSAIITGDETFTHRFESIGTLAYITDFELLSDGLLGIVAKGGSRVRILDSHREPDGLYRGSLETLPPEPDTELPDGYAGMACLLREWLGHLGELYADLPMRYGSASWLGYRFSEILPISVAQKQSYLEMEDAMRRLDNVRPLLEAIQTGSIEPDDQ